VGAGRPLLRMFFPGCVCVRVRESRKECVYLFGHDLFFDLALCFVAQLKNTHPCIRKTYQSEMYQTQDTDAYVVLHHNIQTHTLSHHMHDGCVSDTSVCESPGTTTAPHKRTKSPAAFLSFLSSRALRVLPFAICSTARAGCSRIVLLGRSKVRSSHQNIRISMDECVGKGVQVCVCACIMLGDRRMIGCFSDVRGE